MIYFKLQKVLNFCRKLQVIKMTESFEEKRATINGHEIAIQCLIMDIGKTLREKKLHYHSYIELILCLAARRASVPAFIR